MLIESDENSKYFIGCNYHRHFFDAEGRSVKYDISMKEMSQILWSPMIKSGNNFVYFLKLYDFLKN